MTVQSFTGGYGEDNEIAWQWLLAQYTPVVSILIAAVFSEPTKVWKEKPANMWRYRWALGISLFQALAIFIVLILPGAFEVSPFLLFAKTQIALSLLQGIAVAAVGAVIFDGR
ncbi:hypothetical protein [Sphingobium xenophagum]|uniref:hypothetical protein n=1 Tax=Sphingobium xenophagum TaxID=121428 RepID=UPI0010309A67|nr:hypothetical protein [Sphingobium xenophagum]